MPGGRPTSRRRIWRIQEPWTPSWNTSCLLRFPFQVFLCPVHCDVPDQLYRNWFIERKSEGALRPLVTREFFLEGFPNSVSGTEDRLVVLEGGEIQQRRAMELEGRHLIAEDFLGLRYGFLDGSSDGLQRGLNIFRERSNVFVYASEVRLGHSIHSVIRRDRRMLTA